MIHKIKKILRESKITSELYTKLAEIKFKYIHRRNIKKNKTIFKNNSLGIMKEVQTVFSTCEYINDFIFMFGTLLGAYRDKKLIANDMDIDVGVYLLDKRKLDLFRAYMKNNGFLLKHYYAISDDVIQDTYSKNGVSIDVAFLQKADDYDYCYLVYDDKSEKDNVLMFPFASVNEIESYNFDDIQINIPSDVEQYLADTYGDDWRIPNPNYKYWENPKAKKVNLTADITICSKGV